MSRRVICERQLPGESQRILRRHSITEPPWRYQHLYYSLYTFNTLKYLYNAVHIHVHIFCIFLKRTDTVRTVSSGKTETDQSNVYVLEANTHVIISTTLGTVFLDL